MSKLPWRATKIRFKRKLSVTIVSKRPKKCIFNVYGKFSYFELNSIPKFRWGNRGSGQFYDWLLEI